MPPSGDRPSHAAEMLVVLYVLAMTALAVALVIGAWIGLRHISKYRRRLMRS